MKIEERLGDGDVTLAVLYEKLELILDQTTQTNGRVSKLEKFMAAVRWFFIGCLGFVILDSVGITGTILKWFNI